MTTTTLNVSGYFSDDGQGFDKLFPLRRELEKAQGAVKFSFQNCTFVSPPALAYIAALIQEAHQRGVRVSIDQDVRNDAVREHVTTNRLFDALLKGKQDTSKPTTVPLRVDTVRSDDDFVNYLRSDWLGERVAFEDDLRDKIISSVLEIYLNVFDHAESRVGVAVCGQHFPKKQTLSIAFVDFGVGIPYNVRQFLGQANYPAEDALSWAFQDGKTTKRDLVPRAIGLKNLKRFIQKNKGSLNVYTDGARLELDMSGERSFRHASAYGGTIVYVTLQCDQTLYRLEDILNQPDDGEPLF